MWELYDLKGALNSKFEAKNLKFKTKAQFKNEDSISKLETFKTS